MIIKKCENCNCKFKFESSQVCTERQTRTITKKTISDRKIPYSEHSVVGRACPATVHYEIFDVEELVQFVICPACIEKSIIHRKTLTEKVKESYKRREQVIIVSDERGLL